ncbi:MAG TPA: hypothetical protein VEI97_14625 [bacterium]|nr:hypothetical protein [bacterium]
MKYPYMLDVWDLGGGFDPDALPDIRVLEIGGPSDEANIRLQFRPQCVPTLFPVTDVIGPSRLEWHGRLERGSDEAAAYEHYKRQVLTPQGLRAFLAAYGDKAPASVRRMAQSVLDNNPNTEESGDGSRPPRAAEYADPEGHASHEGAPEGVKDTDPSRGTERRQPGRPLVHRRGNAGGHR